MSAMAYAIRHVTAFEYDGPVRFARCNLRLKPIAWSGQVVHDYRLLTGREGSTRPARGGGGVANVMRLTIDRPVQTLTIESRFGVTVDRPLPTPDATDPTLADVAAMARASRDPTGLGPAPYLYPSPLIAPDAAIADWAAADLAPDRPVLEALFALAGRIRAEFAFDPDATAVDTRPAEAFAKRGGVCQDFTHIMLAGLRAAGLPAAYASGYIRTIPPPGKARLVGADATHAWVLGWCGPRLGWVGVDPTNGIWMANDHVLVAIGRDYSDVAPIDGVLLGRKARRMTVSVDVAPADELRPPAQSPR